MALSAVGTTYEVNNRREDLLQKLHRISLESRPFLNLCGVGKATGTYHEWVADIITIGTDNAQTEGGTFSYDTLVTPARSGNITQILRRTWQVSLTEEAVDHAGFKSRQAYEKDRALRFILNDLEHAIITGSTASGATSTARRMNGILNALSSNATANTSLALTEAIFQNLAKLVWLYEEEGPTDVLCNAYLASLIDAFTGNSTRYQNIIQRNDQLSASITDYRCRWGRMMIHVSQNMPEASNDCSILYCKRNNETKVAYLRGPKTYTLTPEQLQADAVGGAILIEGTLQWGSDGNYALGTGFRNS